MQHLSQIESLIKMANQIGGFFNSYTDRELARREVANHLEKFWEPRMRRSLLDYNDKHRTLNNDLLPLVREALKILPPPSPAHIIRVAGAGAGDIAAHP
ncbi:MAG TPA: formate dehydrogenase subunit delta [Rhodocyclaceae bacterium]|nr:formate dehydrogenase subunit delta [Rhodocyclaceae bacterium]